MIMAVQCTCVTQCTCKASALCDACMLQQQTKEGFGGRARGNQVQHYEWVGKAVIRNRSQGLNANRPISLGEGRAGGQVV